MSVIIPTMVFDNFFQNPDLVREFALKQQYFVSKNNNYPGVRTNLLSEINAEFFHRVIAKITGLMYNSYTHFQYMADAQFQIVTEEHGEGWVHSDGPDALLTAIIYLTPGSLSGTSIYKVKEPITSKLNEYKEERKLSFIKKDGVHAPSRDLHNNNFTETIKVSGVYNRMLIFDSHLNHAAHYFFGKLHEEARLTLIIFIRQISATDVMPAVRANRLGNGI